MVEEVERFFYVNKFGHVDDDGGGVDICKIFFINKGGRKGDYWRWSLVSLHLWAFFHINLQSKIRFL